MEHQVLTPLLFLSTFRPGLLNVTLNRERMSNYLILRAHTYNTYQVSAETYKGRQYIF